MYRSLLSAALDPDRPLLAQIVVTERCNLSCGYLRIRATTSASRR
jgi:hypothetical protein